jgi:hypothetical protein
MKLGNTILVKPGERQKFQTVNDAVIKEISPHSVDSDIMYKNLKIRNTFVSNRKTQLSNWHKYFGFIQELR